MCSLFKFALQPRGYQDLNAGPRVGWLVWPSGTNIFFDLPIFWAKNGLEASHKPLSPVSCCKTEEREQQLRFEHICKDKIMTMIRWWSCCKVLKIWPVDGGKMCHKFTNIMIILQNTSRTSKQCQDQGKVDNGI
jgi:hypothetical protein